MATNEEGPVTAPAAITQRRSLSGSARTFTAISSTASSSSSSIGGNSGSSIAGASLEHRPSRLLPRSSISKHASRASVVDDGRSGPELTSVSETDPPASSSTVLRLRALARAVRAGQVLGRDASQQRRGQYIMMSAKSSAAFNSKDSYDADNDDSSFAFNARVPIHFDSSVGASPAVSSAPAQTSSKARPATSGPTRAKASGQAKAAPLMLTRASNAKLTSRANGTKEDGAGSAGDRRGSQALANTTLQRLGSIRGDLSALLSAFDPQLVSGNQKASAEKPASASVQLADNLDARLCCARSLYKLSCERGGEGAIIRGGAIAQIADFTDMEDPRLLRYAAATLANLTAVDDLPVLEHFVKLDGASALLELSWTPSIDVKLLCTTALCRLTQHAVFAALLVRDRAMNELSAMLAIPHPRLQLLVISCILNLVHHGTILPDKVFLGDPHALQNPLGVLSVVSQQAASPTSSAFAVEVLFNMSLSRSGCSCALRGGGAEILYALATQVTKAIDALAQHADAMDKKEALSGATKSNASENMVAAPWMANCHALLKLLRLMAATLASFSAMTEYHTLLSGYGMRTLSVLLVAPLRELQASKNDRRRETGGSSSSGEDSNEGESDEWSEDSANSGQIPPGRRLRTVAVSCARALANFASNAEFRRHAFQEDTVHMVVQLTLVDHCFLPQPVGSSDVASDRYEWTPRRAFACNIVRVLTNLSFEETCSASFMEFPHVLQLLHAIAVHPPAPENSVNGSVSPLPAVSPSKTSPTYLFRFWLTNAVVCEGMKEDALVAILNLAHQGVYTGPLLRSLDGRRLAQAAEESSGHSWRLRYVYALVLSNLLFQNHLQQSVFGDQALTALVSGFNHARRPDADLKGDSFSHDGAVDPDNTSVDTDALLSLRALHLASDDDRERFLAAIFVVASELMGGSNIARVVRLVAECLHAHLDSISLPRSVSFVSSRGRGFPTAAAAPASALQQQRAALMRQHPITCYAAAALHAMARSATQRGDKQSPVFSEDVVALLIRVCAPTPKSCGGFSAAGTKSPGCCSGSGTAAAASSKSPSSPVTKTSLSSSKTAATLPNYCGMTQAFCASTLYHHCVAAGGGGSVDARVVQGLIDCCNEHEETQSLLACSASFAIISFSQDGCRLLTRCHDLARALNRLGRSSHVESQLYAAITACNVSTLQCVWSSAELRDFIVVALLRANSVQAKQIHSKTLSNLLSHVQIRPQIIEDGVLYALMKLSQVLLSSGAGGVSSNGGGGTGASKEDIGGSFRSSLSSSSSPLPVLEHAATPTVASSAPTTVQLLSIGLQALFNLSCEHEYHPKLLSNGVMAYLSTVVAASHHHNAQTQSASDGVGSPPAAGVSRSASSLTASLSLSYQKHRGAEGKSSSTKSASSPTTASRSVTFTAPGLTNEDVVTHLSVESRRYVLGIVCNLASVEENHKELMHAHVAAIIRKCVDPRDMEARASAAMALRNLSCRMPWVEMLCERKTLLLLLALVEPGGGHAVVRQFAMQAVANCSLVTDSLHLLAELRVPRAVLGLLEAATVDHSAAQVPAGRCTGSEDSSAMVETYMAALKCLHNAALDDALALQLVDECVVLRLVPLLEYRSVGAKEAACELVATMVKTLAGKARCAEALLKQRAVSLCALLHRKHPDSAHIAHECVSVLMTLSMCQQIQAALVETQAIHVVVSICSSPLAQVHTRLRDFGAITIRNLTLSATEQLALFYGDAGLEVSAEAVALAPRAGGDAANGGRDHSPSRGQRLSDLGRNTTKRSKSHSQEVAEPAGEFQDGECQDGDGRSSIARANVSRLAERHLFYGLKYFQQEIASGCASERVLLEASAALSNMSTVHAFRPALVRVGAVQTLLSLHALEAAPRSREQSTGGSVGQHTLMQRICAATLHRLVVADGGAASAADGDCNVLVPSLLAVLRLTDVELHQVRYECEKVSVYAPQVQNAHARRFSLVQAVGSGCSPASDKGDSVPVSDGAGQHRRSGLSAVASAVGAVGASQFMQTIMVPAATQCVTHTYREQKWMVYVIKTSLSSQNMVPQLEKKQLRAVGLPRLSFQDAGGATGAGQSARAEAEGGYLLNVAKDKYLVEHDRDGNEFVVPASGNKVPIHTSNTAKSANNLLEQRTGSIDLSAVTADGDWSGQDADDVDSIIHQRKFDRHMRLSRRNLRHNPGGNGISSAGTSGATMAPIPQG